MHPADEARVALFQALAAIPLAVEQVAEFAGPARAGLLANLSESHKLRELLRELPSESPPLLDQVERALDAVQGWLVGSMMAAEVDHESLGRIVSEILSLEARGQERDALLRDCEAYAGLERRELRLELALAVRALRRGKPRRAKLRLGDAELPQLCAVVRTLVRELREVEILAAVPFEELQHAAAAIRRFWPAQPVAKARTGRGPSAYRGELESLEQFSGRIGGSLSEVSETEALPRGGVPRRDATLLQRRVPLLPRQASVAAATAVIVPSEDWRTLLGRKGEWLVVQKQLTRWRSILELRPDRAAAVLGEVVSRYWRVEDDRSVRTAVQELLAAPTPRWLEEQLFQRLIWPASTGAGDGMGFDVIGLSEDLSTWLCLEVKSTDGPPGTPFEMTVNELRCARSEGDRYAIARVSRVSSTPSIAYWRNPALLFDAGRLALMPVRYQVAVREVAEGAES